MGFKMLDDVVEKFDTRFDLLMERLDQIEKKIDELKEK